MSSAKRQRNIERRALVILMRKMAREVGIPCSAKISEIVSQLAGEPLSKSQAYAWLRNQGLQYHGMEPRRAPATKAKPKAPSAGRRTVAQRRAESDAFYNSKEWRRVRFDALQAGSGCCNLCGRSNREHGIILHVDHIKPRSKFPKLALVLANLQVLCEDCNLGKGNRDDTDWRPPTGDSSLGRTDRPHLTLVPQDTAQSPEAAPGVGRQGAA